jgi:hypothetical protein
VIFQHGDGTQAGRGGGCGAPKRHANPRRPSGAPYPPYDFQNPGGAGTVQGEADLTAATLASLGHARRLDDGRYLSG